MNTVNVVLFAMNMSDAMEQVAIFYASTGKKPASVILLDAGIETFSSGGHNLRLTTCVGPIPVGYHRVQKEANE